MYTDYLIKKQNLRAYVLAFLRLFTPSGTKMHGLMGFAINVFFVDDCALTGTILG